MVCVERIEMHETERERDDTEGSSVRHVLREQKLESLREMVQRGAERRMCLEDRLE